MVAGVFVGAVRWLHPSMVLHGLFRTTHVFSPNIPTLTHNLLRLPGTSVAVVLLDKLPLCGHVLAIQLDYFLADFICQCLQMAGSWKC